MPHLNRLFRSVRRALHIHDFAGHRYKGAACAGLGLLLKSMVLCLILFYAPKTIGVSNSLHNSNALNNPQVCSYDGTNGGESITGWITNNSTGAPVLNGGVVPRDTTLRLDAIDTANGQCTVQCDTITTNYERTVNKIIIGMYASTTGSLNGQYTVGQVFGKDPATGLTKDYHALDTQDSATSTGPGSVLLSTPGTYQFYFANIINITPCSLMPDRVEFGYITVYVSDKDDDRNNGCTSCNQNVGEPINVTNGNMYVQHADFVLPGLGGELRIARTYNSNSKRTGFFGLGWSSILDLSINKAVVYLFIATALSIAIGIVFMRLRVGTSPDRRQTVGETIYEIAQTQIAEQGLPHKAIGLWFPYVASLFLFIWVSMLLVFLTRDLELDPIVFGVLLLNNYGKYFARRRAIELGLVVLGILLVILTIAGRPVRSQR